MSFSFISWCYNSILYFITLFFKMFKKLIYTLKLSWTIPQNFLLFFWKVANLFMMMSMLSLNCISSRLTSPNPCWWKAVWCCLFHLWTQWVCGPCFEIQGSVGPKWTRNHQYQIPQPGCRAESGISCRSCRSWCAWFRSWGHGTSTWTRTLTD